MKYRNALIVIILVALDQLLKWLAASGKILFDTKYLAFNLVKNTGASFGSLQGMNSYLIWVSIIAIGFVLYFIAKSDSKEKLFLSLILAGIIGNFIDRVSLGYVVDFVDFKFFPVFNLADSLIVIGVILMLLMHFQNSSISSNLSK